jgi:ATP-binding cassette subfamily B protein
MNYEKAKSQEPTVFLVRKLWRFAHGMHKRIVLYVAMLVAANLTVLAKPLIFGAIIAEVQARGVSDDNFAHLCFLLSLLLVQTLVFWLLHGPARVIERVVAFWTEINYRRYLLGGVLGLGLTWHGEHDSGDTIDKVNKASEGLTEFGQNVYQIVEVVVKLLGTTAVLIWLSPWIGVTVFGFVLVSFFTIFQFDKRLLPQYRQLNLFSNKAVASVFDALSNVTTVKILHIEKPVLDGVIGRFTDPHKLYRQNSVLNEWKWATGNMLFQAINVVPMIGFLAYAISHQQTIDAGQISTLYLYLADLVFVYFGFGGFYEQMALYKNRILNAYPIEKAFEDQSTGPRSVMSGFERMSISDLRFAYDTGQERLHLDGISLSFKRGERVAVIGESGSGKSTFLKVLHGMYPNAEAKLQVDDADGFDTSFADIDLKTMLVPQEPEIFSSTIGENITLGINYSDAAVELAAHISAFDKVVAELPRGYESVVNEKGVNLSGGQKQRLALARAILFSTDKDIILLDESTSSVDPENETEIYERIFDTFHDKTVIASIHKMNLLRLFDRIVMFEEGKIADEGTFEELMARNPDFRASFEQFVSTH